MARYLAAGLGVVLLLMAGIVVVAVYSASRVDRSARSRLVEDAFPLRAASRALVTDMVDEEAGVRGFLITGTASSLEPYLSGRRAVAADLRAIGSHLAAHPDLAPLVARERRQIAAVNAFFADEVALARRGAQGRALARARVLAGTARFAAFRRTAAEVDGRVRALAAAAERSQQDTYHRMVVLVAALGGVALVLGVAIAVALLRVVSQNAARLERAVVEREQRSADLARSNAQLQEFAYVASHDLSEPLRAVSGFAQLLGRRYRGRLDADADEFIDFIVAGADRMQRLIADLLDYSRAGRGELRRTRVDTGAVMRQVAATLAERASQSGSTIAFDGLPTVMADEGQLERVLQNLVGNGLKFVRPGEPARVEVSASRREGAWCFCVGDAGIGVAPEQSDRVFRVFQRLNTRDEYPGTGVGLAVTKTIVERHGGRIWITPNEPVGSRFWFTIPDPEEAAWR